MDKQQIGRVGFYPTHFLLIGVLALLASNVFAGVLSDAQKYYNEGKVAEALDQFEQVQYKDPNEVTLLYNQANCQYQLGRTDRAVELYEKVLGQSKDKSLQAKAHYNLGNCLFQQADSQPEEKNLNDALKQLQSSAKHYRQFLLTHPDDADAKHNMALVRHLMAQIVERIQQQEKQQQQDQEKKEDLAEKIRQLLKRQNDLIHNTGVIQEAQQSGIADPNVITSQRQILFSGQSGLKDDTLVVQGEVQQTLAQQQQNAAPPGQTLPQTNAPVGPSAYEVVNNEMILAVDNQVQAADDLNNSILPDAIVDQTEAAQHLQKALDALKQDQEQEQQQQNEDQDNKEDSENKQDESKQDNNEGQDSQNKDQQEQEPPEEGQDQNQDDQKVMPLDQTAQEILDKEKERNQQKRKVILQGGKGVEKNW